jgi:hypothetical protein
MSKEINSTERLANELLLERYKPLMVVKLSRSATNSLSDRLETFAVDLSNKTNYEVLVFPDEDITSVEIVSVCNTEILEIENIREYVYGKYEKKEDLNNTPYTKVKDFIKKK